MNLQRQKILVISFVLFAAVSLSLMSSREARISSGPSSGGIFSFPLSNVRQSPEVAAPSAAEYLKQVEELRKKTGNPNTKAIGKAEDFLNVAREAQEILGTTPMNVSLPQNLPTTGGAAGFFSLASMWQAVADPDMLSVAFMYQHYGDPGSYASIFGSGFSQSDNTVYFNDYAIEGISSINGIQLIFNIPIDLAPGRYTVKVGNEKGISDPGTIFIVTRPGAALPVISSITPLTAKYGEEITITGTGFSKTGNDIYTSYAVIENVPSPDGKTLKFSVKPFENTPEFQTQSFTYPAGELNGYPIFIGVINDNGIGFYQNPLNLNL